RDTRSGRRAAAAGTSIRAASRPCGRSRTSASPTRWRGPAWRRTSCGRSDAAARIRPTPERSRMPDALVERDGPMLIVTMNRPQRMNALTGAMLIRMYDAYVDASRDPAIRCILLTGAGGNFCAGADLRGMSGDAGAEDPEIDVPARL